MFFYFIFYSESPKNILQDVGSQFYNFIIFLAIIILEKLEMLEIYQKNQIICFAIKKTRKIQNSKFKIEIFEN